MEIKFSILTQDHEGNRHNVGCDTDRETAEKLIDLLLKGLDPNKLDDITIHPEIRK